MAVVQAEPRFEQAKNSIFRKEEMLWQAVDKLHHELWAVSLEERIALFNAGTLRDWFGAMAHSGEILNATIRFYRERDWRTEREYQELSAAYVACFAVAQQCFDSIDRAA